jgi:Fur family ferric uptake transcriptional regulator
VSEPTLGQRRTSQRDAIHRVIRESQGPLTVDEIHARAKRSAKGLGIATVYRTVKLLLDADEIAAVTLPDGQTRYEAADLGHHHHFRCRGCGKVYDFDVCPLTLTGADALPQGFIVDGHELTLFGTCPSCGKSGRGKSAPAPSHKHSEHCAH